MSVCLLSYVCMSVVLCLYVCCLMSVCLLSYVCMSVVLCLYVCCLMSVCLLSYVCMSVVLNFVCMSVIIVPTCACICILLSVCLFACYYCRDVSSVCLSAISLSVCLSLQSILCQRTLTCAARSADISQDGTLVAVGQTNGEFLVLMTSDLSVLRRKRDRSKTLQVVR